VLGRFNFFGMNKLIVLISESYQEMVNKVTWPSINSLQSSSVLVLVASLIFAIFIGLIDLGFENVMSLFYENF
jgi:preprotein translocase subunit SecE|tara:strand:- start:39188 stop:39406 length:219 start_codon:yes stop_codon:yes gene_type:complete